MLFDLDGVLVDSVAASRRAWIWWASRHGLDPEPFLNAHGRPTRDAIREFAPDLDVGVEEAVVDERESTDTEGVVALPGAADLLSSDRRLAIVTSCGPRLALARLAAAELPVPDVVITADDVAHGKPDPEPYLLGASRLGLEPEDCTVFEDAPAGVRAGKAAGMRVVGLTTTVSARSLAAADLIVADLAEWQRREGLG
jgi:sugar-phosphatase